MKQKTIITILSILAVAVVVVALVVFTSGKNRRLYNFNDPSLDPNLEISEARVTDIEIAVLESFPVQVNVTAYGELNDGCTDLHEVERERVGNTFKVTITTEREKDAICTEAIRPFEETFPLDVENLPAGEYVVTVNDVRGTFSLEIDNIVEFDAGEK